MKAAFLYTGQGFQYKHMLRELPDCESMRRILKEAQEILNCDIRKLDTEEGIRSNENTQICIFLCERIWSEWLRKRWDCQIVSGHSIGSFSAAVEAGALDFEQALRLVQIRGRHMERLFPEGYGMMAVEGMTSGLMEQVLGSFTSQESGRAVFLAAVNGQTQCVISGDRDSLNRLNAYIHKDYPARTHLLSVKVPSHSPLMEPVEKRLAESCQEIYWKKAGLPYLSNSRGRRVWNSQQIKEDLIQGVSHTVRWYEGISLMKELGVERFIEIGPARVLTEIGRKNAPELCWLTGREALNFRER